MAPVGTRGARKAPTAAAAAAASYYGEESTLIELSPEQVMYLAIGFIVVVFILHIFGKLAA